MYINITFKRFLNVIYDVLSRDQHSQLLHEPVKTYY